MRLIGFRAKKISLFEKFMENSNKDLVRKAFLEQLRELEPLQLSSKDYAITGSGPMAIRGMRKAKDIDLIVKRSLWQKLVQQFTPYDDKHIKIGNLEIWGDFINLTEHMDKVIDSADLLFGYPFVSLPDTLCWKKHLNREKDQKDIKLIEEFLALTPGIYAEPPLHFSPDLHSVGCYLIHGNKMLFLQKAQREWSANQWGIPCGKVEEDDLSDAIVREVFEETKIHIDKKLLKSLGCFYIISLERLQYIFHAFFYPLSRQHPVILSPEHQAFRWISLEEALLFPLLPFQKEALLLQKEKFRWNEKESSAPKS
jgi:8-oxo-dGTP pyrophosphatase MutT (NUDIX family)